MVITKLKIKVVPGASSAGVSGWLGDCLKIRVPQPPEKGKANAAVEAIVCELLQLPKGSARIVAGQTSPQKVMEIHGLSEAEIRQRIAGHTGSD